MTKHYVPHLRKAVESDAGGMAVFDCAPPHMGEKVKQKFHSSDFLPGVIPARFAAWLQFVDTDAAGTYRKHHGDLYPRAQDSKAKACTSCKCSTPGMGQNHVRGECCKFFCQPGILRSHLCFFALCICCAQSGQTRNATGCPKVGRSRCQSQSFCPEICATEKIQASLSTNHELLQKRRGCTSCTSR